jgi:hypothetical protein
VELSRKFLDSNTAFLSQHPQQSENAQDLAFAPASTDVSLGFDAMWFIRV